MFERSRPQPLLIAMATAIIVLMFYLGSQPFAAGLIKAPWDKLAHFLTYATLTVTLRVGIGGNQPWLLVILIALIGSLDEWRQLSIPGRSAELSDLATDVAAAIVAILACQLYAARRKQ